MTETRLRDGKSGISIVADVFVGGADTVDDERARGTYSGGRVGDRALHFRPLLQLTCVERGGLFGDGREIVDGAERGSDRHGRDGAVGAHPQQPLAVQR